jgi:hypothetical protein
MRFWLSVFLMVFLPLQSAWSAAAPYCKHENSAFASHFGHHVHEHHGDESTPSASQNLSDASAPTETDADCAPCHGMGSAMVRHVSMSDFFAGQNHYPSRLAGEYPLPPHLRPERPQWSSLA